MTDAVMGRGERKDAAAIVNPEIKYLPMTCCSCDGRSSDGGFASRSWSRSVRACAADKSNGGSNSGDGSLSALERALLAACSSEINSGTNCLLRGVVLYRRRSGRTNQQRRRPAYLRDYLCPGYDLWAEPVVPPVDSIRHALKWFTYFARRRFERTRYVSEKEMDAPGCTAAKAKAAPTRVKNSPTPKLKPSV